MSRLDVYRMSNCEERTSYRKFKQKELTSYHDNQPDDHAPDCGSTRPLFRTITLPTVFSATSYPPPPKPPPLNAFLRLTPHVRDPPGEPSGKRSRGRCPNGQLRRVEVIPPSPHPLALSSPNPFNPLCDSKIFHDRTCGPARTVSFETMDLQIMTPATVCFRQL
ncbi:hypothetical protein CROQUDRAFT_97319 [Cronartium quercuum f. sp. fusiforme G11]|uniref:Uncharacterized protein n=1 Tax=Cronartium quercuum f. sp. fusiforme G11 TaxID=708437 RepID=A0A9P6N9S9_9BASI|nr:hypothetical protein CROQUDRAFT_97319 [Cronartium quercuum f. sp. fusiforme G11]